MTSHDSPHNKPRRMHMLTTRPGAYLWCSATSWPLGRCPVKGSLFCSADGMIHFCQDKALGAAFPAMCLTAPRQQKEPRAMANNFEATFAKSRIPQLCKCQAT